MENRLPEILAPAGDSESLTAAVRSGADAVYFGAKEFNARRNAGNLNDNALKESILYCKKYNVLTYLTLNILINDSEFSNAVTLAAKAYALGIDGIIIQDIGLAQQIHSLIPKLDLHASTQMSVTSPAAFDFLKSCGFTRVVAPRELSRTELENYCLRAAEAGLEVEVFVHGALCMSVSGQCYFSAFLGGRSANRGLCAGPCRLPFNSKGGTGHDLSLKDLSLINHIAALKKIGVSSLKIEGRMKSPEYTAACVHCFKSALLTDSINKSDYLLLENVFSRSGFTDGYFCGSTGRDMFGIRSEENKTATADVLGTVHNWYRREPQRIPVCFKAEFKKGKPAKLTAFCAETSVTCFGDVCDPAAKRSAEKQEIAQRLEKLGSTPYFAKRTDIDLEEGIAISASALNSLKNEAVQKLTDLRLHAAKRPEYKSVSPILPNAAQKTKKIAKYRFARFAAEQQLPHDLSVISGCSLPANVLLKMRRLPFLNSAAEDYLAVPAAELPRICINDNQTTDLLLKCRKIGIKAVVCNNLSQIALAAREGFSIISGFGLNLFNSWSAYVLNGQGVDMAVISPELSVRQIEDLNIPSGIKTLYFAYGRQPLMLTRNCPVKNGVGCAGKKSTCYITDRKQKSFAVLCNNGFCEILNTKITNIKCPEKHLNADYAYYYFTLEDKKEVLTALTQCDSAPLSGEKYTNGLSKNGVL